MKSNVKKRMVMAIGATGASLALLALGSGAMKVSDKRNGRKEAREKERARWIEIVSDFDSKASVRRNPEALIKILASRVR